MKLNGKLALITGGGRGIGRAVAFAFAAEGAHIAVASRTTDEVGRVALQISNEFDVTTTAVDCDVAKRASVERMFEIVENHFGRKVEILVNNAGVAESAPLTKTDDEMWRKHLSINLDGTFYCTRRALPAMLETGWGRIINIASIAGKTGAPYIAAYAASKHGVLGLTRVAALEVASKGVTVNAICPGYVDTPMTTRAVENITARTTQDEKEARGMLERMNPQNRLVTSEEVAALAVLLASGAGRGINGQAINIDGGTVLF